MTKSGSSSDAQLVERTLAGGGEAYRELVGRYQGHVYGLAYSVVGNWADAQDIAQETFIRAYTNLGQLREPARFPAWLRRVAFSVAMAWLKSFRPGLFGKLNGQVDLESLEIPDFQPGPAETAEKRELADAVLAAVAALPPKYRVPLTMFHLDGLSYKKVADFLDIPLGTAKSLIARARAKLRAILTAGESAVRDVFDEHKLPADFARRVLENIGELRWENGDCMFAGAVLACMKHLEREVTFDFVMGVSGCAFKLWWDPSWKGVGESAFLGEETVAQTFKALGFACEIRLDIHASPQAADEELLRRRIVDSIDKGKPVVALGVVGPAECGIVAGYEESGRVLAGRSYFYDGSKGYYRKRDWFKDCHGLILVGDELKRPTTRTALHDAVARCIELAKTPRRGGLVSGLSAYPAWAEALRRDGDFPAGDLEVLTLRCHVSNSVVLSALRDARKAAAGFLREMAAAGEAPPDVLRAAASYDEEERLLDQAMKLAPHCHESSERRLKMADPELRMELARLITLAGGKDAEAVAHLEKALKSMCETQGAAK